MLKEIRKNYKRLVAFLLSITMIIMNMGGNAITAFAGEEREISLFMAEGEKILEAAAHLQDQEEFTKEDLEEMGLDAPKNSIIKKYEKLFLPEEGKIYELDVDIDDHLAAEGTELRIFYHSKEKEVIFLFLNESNQDIDFCVNIDGYETELVTVASNTAAVEAGEEETSEELEGKENKDEKEPGEGSGKKDNGTVSGGNSGGTSASVSGGASGGGTKETSGNLSGETSDDTSDKTSESTSKDNLENTPEGAGESESKVNDDKADEKVDEADEKETVDKADSAEVNDEKEAGEDEAAKEDSAETNSEKKDEAVKEDSAETNSEKKDEAVKEGSAETNSEKKGEAVKEDSAETNSEKKDEAVKEDSAETNSEKKDEAVKDDSAKEQPEKKDEAAKEEPAEKQSDKKEESVKEDTAKSEDRGSSEDKSSEDKSSKGESAEKSDSSSQEKDSHDKGSSNDEGKDLSLSNHKTAMVFVSLDALEDLEAEGEAKETEPETAAEAAEDVKEETQEEEAEEITEETTAEVSKEETKEETTAEQEPAEEEKESQKTSEPETAAEVTTAVEESVKETAVQEESAGTAEETVAEGEAQTEEESTANEVISEIPQESVSETLETEEITEAAMQEETSAKADEETTLQESIKETSAEQEEKADGAVSADEEENEVSGEDDGNYDDWEIPGKAYDAVTIRQTITAKAYCVDLEDVKKAVELSQGTEEKQAEFHVDYLVNVDEAAEIIGDAYVAEGEDLYFAVEPKEGFEIASVHVNGNMAEAVEAPESLEASSSWKGYAYVYRVEDVVEDLCIEVEIAELETIIAAAVYTAETSDAIFTVDVPEGAFEEEVELRASRIEEETELQELTEQANNALKEEQSIVDVLAYDISFISLETGEEVEPLKPVAVSMNFKEAIVSDKDANEVKEISVVHLPDSAQAETVTTVENTDTTEFSFQTDSFSKYLLAVVMTPKVSVDGNSYPTITRAVAASEDGAIITLLDDITESVEMEDRSFTIDLNGHTWTGRNDTVITANMNKKDVSLTLKGGKIVAASGYRAVEMDINRYGADTHGELNIIGVDLQGSKDALVNSEGISFYGTTKKSGGIIAALDTDIYMDSCELWDGNAGGNGGAVTVSPYSTDSKIKTIFTQCHFHDNVTSGKGGAISVELMNSVKGREVLFTMDNCIFENNRASSGGAISLESNNSGAKASMKAEISGDTQFTGNEATSSGGAIYFDNRNVFENDALTITDCYFTKNTAKSSNGGAINTKSALNLQNVNLEENKSGSKGGAVFIDNTYAAEVNASIRETRFVKNEAVIGGALALNASKATSGVIALQDNCAFEKNISSSSGSFAPEGGGAIYSELPKGVALVVSNIVMHGNSTNGFGGTISGKVKNLSMKNAEIYENQSKKDGGALYLANIAGAKYEFEDCELRNNTSGANGGAISFPSTSTTGEAVFKACKIVENTAAKNGGGVYSILPEISFEDTEVNGNTANKYYGGGAYLATYAGGGKYTVSGSSSFYGNKAPNDPKTATFKISGNTPSADIFVRNCSTKSTAKSNAELIGFDDIPAKSSGNVTYILAHTNPATQKYGNINGGSTSSPNYTACTYSVGYYSTKEIGDCVYLSASDAHVSTDNVIVKPTLQEAVVSAKEKNYQEVYVCSTVDITKEDEECLNNSGIVFKRCPECKDNALFNIKDGEDVIFDGIKIDGDKILANAALITVSGTLNINGNTDIRGGNNSASSGGGAIYVSGKAVLNINGGIIEDNVAVRGGAISTSSVDPQINIHGGAIKGNQASREGGAIYSHSAVVRIDGGVLEDNIAGSSGGAICGEGIQKEFGRHSKIYIDGGTFRGNRCGGNGGGAIYVTFFSELYVGQEGRPLFENNSTSELGGAIALYQWASGKIYSGDFRDNKTTSTLTNYAGGGALYINAGCSMEMKNLYLVGNRQSESKIGGGGLYTCPTGRPAIFKTEGAFIAENTGAGGNPADINFVGSNSALAYVSDYVLGGAVANWTKTNGDKASDLWGTKDSFTIVSHVVSEGKATAEAIARKDGVVMENNYSGSYGAAIANNGNLMIGTEELSLTVNKKWEGSETNIPEEILVYLMKSLNGEKAEKVTLGERPDDAFVILNQDKNWSYTWENLSDSSAVDWSVSEAAINGYTGTITGPVRDTAWSGVGKHYIFTLTNLENPNAKLGTLKVTKQLKSSNDNVDETFNFTVSLDAEGPFAYRIVTDEAEGDLQPIYDDLSAIKIGLKAGESFIIEGIPVGTTYTVTEDSGKYLVYVDHQLSEKATAEGSITEEENSLVEIVYTNVEKTQVGVKKIWEDDDDRDGLRPKSITVNLLKVIEEGEAISEASMELNEENGWTGVFENLPKYTLDGKTITWKISELNAGDYTSVITGDAETGFIITNVHIPETVEISGEKIWKDTDNQDGKRPERIIVELYANNEKIESKEITANADGNWNWKFENLPKYYNHGKLIVYTFREAGAGEAGYTAEFVHPNENLDNNYHGTIINTYVPDEVERFVIKKWIDGENQDGFRPESITVQLFADGSPVGDPLVLDEANGWQGEWKNLPKNKGGKEILYEVKEISELSQYTSSVTYEETTRLFTITNRHTPEEKALKVVKAWDDHENQDGLRPESITVQLLADGLPLGDSLTLSEANNWQGEWKNLPKYKNGKEILYEVKETSEVSQYSSSVVYDEVTGVFTITNRHTPAERTLKVVKEWDDQDNQAGFRPSSIEVQLMADGVLQGAAVTLNEGNLWSHEWRNLPRYKNGKEITYEVQETSALGRYTASISYNEETEVFIVTNRYVPEVRTLKARKIWEDHNNQDNLRPASVEVQLMADDEPAGNPVTLNEENQWSCEWKDLPSYKNGKIIAYRVVENTVVENYSVTYSYDEETSIFTITNTHTPEGEKPNEPSEPSTPENPTNPGNPGNSNPPTGGRTRRDRTPSTPQPPTTIPQEEVPLTNFEPEEVPLASLPSDNQVVFVPIEDEGIPLFGLPRTGDRGVSTGILLGMMISSFMVACGIHAKRRKEKEE